MAQGTTRDRILDAANKLFYAEGVRAVSVDAIAAKAGITKKALYYHFVSKDDLVTGYLASRDQPNLALFRAWFEAAPGGIPEKTEAIFATLSENARHPKWNGCGFQRTVAELANQPGHPAVAVGAGHKRSFEAWLAGAYAEAIGDAPKAETLARQVSLLMEGAFALNLMYRDPARIAEAGQTAQILLASAIGPGVPGHSAAHSGR